MAKLHAKQRNALATSEFAGPDRSYPIPDRSHAANAKARVANKSPELKARVDAAVARKYPGMGKSDGGHGAQPQFTGAAKAAHRAQENAVSDKAARGGNQGDMRSGIETAMGAQADKLHAAKKGSIAAPRPPTPSMSNY